MSSDWATNVTLVNNTMSWYNVSASPSVSPKASPSVSPKASPKAALHKSPEIPPKPRATQNDANSKYETSWLCVIIGFICCMYIL